MKTLAVTLIALGMASATAHADGFECRAPHASLDVKVYDHRDPTIGTKKAAVLVLSDPSLDEGKRTIGRYTDTEGTLSNAATHFTVTIGDGDHQGPDSVFIDTVSLDRVTTIDLDIDFNYGAPAEAGEKFAGRITMDKNDGKAVVIDLVCKRYLAN